MPLILNLILATLRLSSGTIGDKFYSSWNLFLTPFIQLRIFSTFITQRCYFFNINSYNFGMEDVIFFFPILLGPRYLISISFHLCLKLPIASRFHLFFKKLFYCSITVLCMYSPPYLSPTPAKPSSLPCFHPLLGFVHVYFIVVPENPFPLFPIIPSHLPSGYCQIVLNFNVSGYILLAFFFCWLGSS